jgi:hypothetical protein
MDPMLIVFSRSLSEFEREVHAAAVLFKSTNNRSKTAGRVSFDYVSTTCTSTCVFTTWGARASECPGQKENRRGLGEMCE